MSEPATEPMLEGKFPQSEGRDDAESNEYTELKRVDENNSHAFRIVLLVALGVIAALALGEFAFQHWLGPGSDESGTIASSERPHQARMRLLRQVRHSRRANQ